MLALHVLLTLFFYLRFFSAPSKVYFIILEQPRFELTNNPLPEIMILFNQENLDHSGVLPSLKVSFQLSLQTFKKGNYNAKYGLGAFEKTTAKPYNYPQDGDADVTPPRPCRNSMCVYAVRHTCRKMRPYLQFPNIPF